MMLVRLNEIIEDDLFRKVSIILCYPRRNESEALSRIAELQSLGVEALLFEGSANLFGIPVLGKGNVGVVVVCLHKAARRALKIRRVDADRETMRKEAMMLERANAVEVGPKLLGSTSNFLLMELIEGAGIAQWLAEAAEPASVKKLVRDLLEQCRSLDSVGVDHGQLSRAHRHVLVDALMGVHIIDFETASVSRRHSNVTSIAHYIFFNKENSRRVQQRLGQLHLETLRSKLRDYKRKRSDESFEAILSFLGLRT